MSLDPTLRDTMLAAVPSLRAFGISLCGNVDRADDLVQETLLRALANIDSFQPGTNMSAWLFTILRNLFRSEYRKRRREVEDADSRDPRRSGLPRRRDAGIVGVHGAPAPGDSQPPPLLPRREPLGPQTEEQHPVARDGARVARPLDEVAAGIR